MTEQLANYPRPMPSHQEPLAVRTLTRGERITERDDIHTFTLAQEVIERAQLGFSIYTLPHYIGIKGGAARPVLRSLMFPDEPQSSPRDIDFVVLQERVEEGGYDEEVIDETVYKLSMKYAPRDTMYGHYGEEVWDIESYMREHDFTLNQVLLTKDRQHKQWQLHATTQAVIDTADNIVRPTIAEYDKDQAWRLSGNLGLKALRLMAEFEDAGAPTALRSVRLPSGLYGEVGYEYFVQTLNLDKALQSGYSVATHYLENLRQHAMLPNDYAHYTDPAELFLQLLEETDFDPSEDALQTIADQESTAET